MPTTQVPTPLVFREVKPDWPRLFKGLGEADPTKPFKWPLAVFETLAGLFNLKPKNAGEEAHLLVRQALAYAIKQVLKSIPEGQFTTLVEVRASDADRLDVELAKQPVELTSRFLTYPGQTPIVGTVARLLAAWLRSAGMDPKDADRSVLTLPAFFVEGLTQELLDHAPKYDRFQKAFQPKFGPIAEAEAAWLQYDIQLQTRANPPVLDLGVSLDSVYVELRAYTEKAKPRDAAPTLLREEQGQKDRIVGMLTEMAQHWLESGTDPIFVLSGGPGAGKSAFARRFAAWRAWAGPTPWRVLYVPLHRFTLGKDLSESLEEFARGEIGHEIRLFDRRDDTRSLLIFDGLDELSQQGTVGEELAADFFRQMDDLVHQKNREIQPFPVCVMLCGRDVAVSNTRAETRKAERVRHALPYYLPERERQNHSWEGQNAILKADQRQIWWSNYGIAIGDPSITGLPEDVATKKLEPLTTEPILNCLIAQCRKTHQIEPETNRASIYGWLVEDVLNRVHDSAGKRHLQGVECKDIAELLEEVAVTAWHEGDMRATTKSKVEERCRKAERTDLLDRVIQGRGSISQLFVSFYFQETGGRLGQEPAIEFSHKSFGEYLLARRIVAMLRSLREKIEGRHWTLKDAQRHWVELCGPALLDDDVLSFIRDLADLESHEVRNAWRKALIDMFNRVLTDGFPMESLGLASFREMERQERAANRNLFAVHSELFRTEQPVFEISWEAGKSSREKSTLILQNMIDYHCQGIGFEGAHVKAANFHRADLRRSLFEKAILPEANFFGAILDFAILDFAILDGASLVGASLDRAFLVGARLVGARLDGAILYFARLDGARLDGARLDRAILVDAILVGASLVGASLDGARLVGARLDFARLDGASLVDARLEGVSLVDASLDGARLVGARLLSANIERANLRNAGITPEQLLPTVGEPAIMPDGDPPKKGWRTKKPRASRKKTGSGGTSPPEGDVTPTPNPSDPAGD